ncbi:uncharacterized protein LOC111917413 [Lactuca sativa]|uniref:Pectinesterase inhibitor domain-containing protein n=1 Tax=Lactuca sativa TaxID=4236 RepID=A0A9R1VIF4_LACSA|nr:uncharacterized protein LOC111917413 [Lactuca sativa]KAJ0205934.1 hypothetical protein LSAT_V11C500298360 [Lactuca sativa]
MKFENRVLVVISIGFLILSISVKCSDLSQFWSIADEVKDAFGPVLNEAEDGIGPVSSFNLDKAEKALGPIPSLDDARQGLGPISSLDFDKARDALSPVVDEAKEKLGPISPSTVEKAKSVTTKALDKVEEGFDSIASWISQNKVDVSSYLEIAQKEFGPVSSLDLDKAKEVLAPISPSLNEALPPISPSTVDEAKDALGPVISPSVVDEAKDALGSEAIDEAKKKLGSITSLFSQKQNTEEISEAEKESSPVASTSTELDKDEAKEAVGSFSHKALDEAKGKFGSLSSLISQNKEEISNAPSPASPSTLDEAEVAIGSISSEALDEAKEAFGSITSFFSKNKVQISSQLAPIYSPVSPSTLDEAKDAIDSFSNKALDEAKDKFGSISSFFSQNKEEISSFSSSSIYIDHDVALAIESLIKQGLSNSKLAIEEARKLLSVTETIASPDRATCVKNCMDNYVSCFDSFNKAMEELTARNAEQMTDDVTSVEGDISACQKCFLENNEVKQSSLKDLEEAILKSTRECLNVLHHSG